MSSLCERKDWRERTDYVISWYSLPPHTIHPTHQISAILECNCTPEALDTLQQHFNA